MNTNQIALLRKKAQAADRAFCIALFAFLLTIPAYLYLDDNSVVFKISVWIAIGTSIVYTILFFIAWIEKWKLILGKK